MKTTPLLAALAAVLLADPSASFAQSSGKLSFGKPKAKSAESAALVTVQAKGQGETVEAAKKDAARNAIKKAVGELVDAKTLVENDELVEDKILTLSNAMIEKADYGDAKSIGDGLFEVPVKAVVKKGKLNQELKAVGLATGTVAGDSLSAAMFTGKERLANAENFFAERLQGFPGNVMEAVMLTKEDGTPAVDVDPMSGHVHANVGVRVNMENYAKWTESFRELFQALCTKRDDIQLRFDKDPYHISKRMISERLPVEWGKPFVLVATPAAGKEQRDTWPASIYHLDNSMAQILIGKVLFQQFPKTGAIEVSLVDKDGEAICSKKSQFRTDPSTLGNRIGCDIHGWNTKYLVPLNSTSFSTIIVAPSPALAYDQSNGEMAQRLQRSQNQTVAFRLDLGEVPEDDLAEVAGYEVKIEYK